MAPASATDYKQSVYDALMTKKLWARNYNFPTDSYKFTTGD